MSFAQSIYGVLPAPLQDALLSMHGRRLRRRRFGSLYRETRETLARAERGGREAVLALQARLLRRLVERAAREVPYYATMVREACIDPGSIREPADLRRLPILSRKTVRDRREELVSRAFPRRALLHGHTSGTTGSSLPLLWDRNVDVVTNAVLWRHREWAGCAFGTRYASLLGRVAVPLSRRRPPFWRENRSWNQMLFSSFHMKEENLDAYADAMERGGVRFLEAYPSTAYVLARHLAARGRVLRLDAVFVSAEPLLSIQRETIEAAFACRAFDYFGAAERSIFAAECPEHRGLHLFDEYGVTELLDPQGEPVEPGAPGRLVVTGLHNFAMPLLRYEIGDVSSLAPEPCPCGRPLPLLLPVTTKAEDLVVLPDGRFISGSVLTHPFKPMTRIAESQIVQERRDLVRILVVPREGYGDRDEAVLLGALRDRLGGGVGVRIERVASIPRGPRGKYRWVVSKVPLAFGEAVGPNLYAGDN
ncbi:MAG: phenylacetate--CoA ligase family protein [Planctomycetaceae bacterium]